MYWPARQINLVMNQNKKIDSAITSKAIKRCAANRKISAMLSVTFFLQLIAKLLSKFVYARGYKARLLKGDSTERAMRREIPRNF
jgi:hypothetical protein